MKSLGSATIKSRSQRGPWDQKEKKKTNCSACKINKQMHEKKKKKENWVGLCCVLPQINSK